MNANEPMPDEQPEHVTDERVEELFNLADEILRAPSRFTKDFIVNELGQAVAELAGAVERSRAVEAKLRAAIADERTRLSQEMESEEREQHPDDAAVVGVRAWLDGLNDEALVEFKVRRLRSVLNVLSGWERYARGVAAQLGGAYSELNAVKAAATARAETAEAQLAELRAEREDCKYRYVGGPTRPGVVEVHPQYEEGEFE